VRRIKKMDPGGMPRGKRMRGGTERMVVVVVVVVIIVLVRSYFFLDGLSL